MLVWTDLSMFFLKNLLFFIVLQHYSLCHAIQVVLGFERCLEKQVVLASVVGLILYQNKSTRLIIITSLAHVVHYHTKTINKRTVEGGYLRTKDGGTAYAARRGSLCINESIHRGIQVMCLEPW